MIVIGGGPAGAAAAIAGTREGAEVALYEQSAFPRHKVCGEFLSPEAAMVFERLGIASGFLALEPWAVRRAEVRFGRAVKRWKLDDPAYGVSRFALDEFLLSQALQSGATLIRERAGKPASPAVIAGGRQQRGPAGKRSFGFKAHFTGPSTDQIDLLFSREVYVGFNCVEGGVTNVCGLASEALLRKHGFQPDRLVEAIPGLPERLRSLNRTMDWLITGPVVFGGRFESDEVHYEAGDALGFVDPFTGSGMLAAISTGMLAGQSCARGRSAQAHCEQCRRLLGRQYSAATLFRKLIGWGVADSLAWMLPGQALFDLTRPAVSRL